MTQVIDKRGLCKQSLSLWLPTYFLSGVGFSKLHLIIYRVWWLTLLTTGPSSLLPQMALKRIHYVTSDFKIALSLFWFPLSTPKNPLMSAVL